MTEMCKLGLFPFLNFQTFALKKIMAIMIFFISVE